MGRGKEAIRVLLATLLHHTREDLFASVGTKHSKMKEQILKTGRANGVQATILRPQLTNLTLETTCTRAKKAACACAQGAKP